MALLLGGCATTKQPLSQSEFVAAMESSSIKIDALMAENKQEEVVGLLSRMASDNPARKEPWVRLAKLHFDAGAYGRAIVAADEVLQRDPADRTAKSVRAVSGLRVATESLAELRKDADLRGSAQADAQSLARNLRETLGEDVLVPVAAIQTSASTEPTPEPVPVKERPRKKVVRPARNDAGGQAPGANPFSSLR
ncbi:MAG TPA: tetratricopeptide repeat protein [Aromatoleum sp.]|uniref:tetratricopeptide repeat protein n=1 Tax=Aromatoleum sp. TaxID=2307007 RepID=UPI002B45E9FF|nr:tetratricopeptide repeat protein [Aromatoleum sp.]HJV27453.1 tetratricopeptide repeat protein [Aromatoleum sp.]